MKCGDSMGSCAVKVVSGLEVIEILIEPLVGFLNTFEFRLRLLDVRIGSESSVKAYPETAKAPQRRASASSANKDPAQYLPYSVQRAISCFPPPSAPS
jgi:hypothetical protein